LLGKGNLLVSECKHDHLYLSTRNIPRTSVSERRNLIAGTILRHANVIFTRSALDALVSELKANKKESA
jgi:ribosomal protein L4